jgi:hypothetical protein
MSAAEGDQITVLRCDPGRRATKRITAAPDGGLVIEGYDAGFLFAVAERPISGIRDLAAALDQVAQDPHALVVRAEPLPGIDRARCRRLLHPHHEDDGSTTPPTFRDVPRRWAVLDFDRVPGPYRFDPRDGELAAVYCRSLLPEAFWRCSCWWGLSASAGFGDGVRIKLAFWIDRPTTGAELARHLKGSPVDLATLRPVQPVFVAAPVVEGVRDPIAVRTGLEEDIYDEVVLPELPVEEAKPAVTHSPTTGRRYVSGDSPARAERRLGALCRTVACAGVGERHRTLLWAAMKGVELDDALPRAAIAAELIAAARHAGLTEAEAELARQVKNGFRLGIFGGTPP